MNQSVLTLAPAGRPLASSLGFEARSVLIDNYTNSYVRLPDAGKDVPPFVYGAVVALPPGIRQASASLIATAPAVAGPAVPTTQATLTWTDQDLPASAGHLLQQSSYSTRVKLYPDGVTPATPTQPSFTVAAGGTATQRFTLPAGTSQIRLLVTANGLLFTYSLLVLGHQTNEQYFGDTGAPGSATAVSTPTLPFTIAIENDWDSQLDMTLVGDASHALSVFVSAILAPEAPGQAGASQSVIIPTAAPWQAPNQAAPFSLNFVAGVPQTIIPAVGAARTFVHSIFIVVNAVTNVAVQDTGGTNVAQGSANAAGIALQTDIKGVATVAGTGIRIVTTANAGLNGVITYAQAT